MSQTPSTDEQGSPAGGDPKGPFGKVWLFLRQVIDELKKVVVPTRRELTNYTLVVLVFVIIVILIVSGLDRVFSTGADWIFGGDGPIEEEGVDAPAPGPEQAPGEELAPEDLEDMNLEDLDIEGGEDGEQLEMEEPEGDDAAE
ncbi:preprotein translocase subunit SecE [Nesterenkonia cremea]|uniref:Protein translocase subunit SecE n=1 Tax=Nesterenkonia cremea TaxID=1882340 RepID=A0A917ARA2_9MICC|nr:preprotein translocase subunit SecE [Nesterenkonia cremea]GGE69324.1 hypothetical protein GCM10011401_15840 [Nesterenkonia cremea]